MYQEWSKLSPEEKREERFRRYISTEGREFVSPEARKAYQERVNRFCNAVKMQTSDRVPIITPDISLDMAGVKFHTAMYDYDEFRRAYRNSIYNFDTDMFVCGYVPSGKVYDLLDTKEYLWPGHGLDLDCPGIQYLDKEYMTADEYDELIKSPNDFLWNKYIARLVGSFAPLTQFYDLTGVIGDIAPSATIMMKLSPAVLSTFQTLIDAAKENWEWLKGSMEINMEAEKAGFPVWKMVAPGGVAPFDDIGNCMRGTRGILIDMYRQPDKLLEAMEFIANMRIERMKRFSAFFTDYPFSSMALHKGGDAFMSDKQFATFYWPPLKKILLALINEGFVPFIFAEGCFNTRLEHFMELPKGSVVWWFESTDMVRAKKILGNTACIAGGITNPMIALSQPQDIKEKCRELIEVCGKDGGFILASGGLGNIDKGKQENVRAMIEAVKEYCP